MAEEVEDGCVMAQLKVLTGLKLPTFNWNAKNIWTEFEIFKQTIAFVLNGMEVPKKKCYLYILQQLGREGWEWWNASIKQTVTESDPDQIFKAFKKGFKITETYWTFRSLYLSSGKEGANESAAALATRVKDLVAQCEWPQGERAKAHRALLSHH